MFKLFNYRFNLDYFFIFFLFTGFILSGFFQQYFTSFRYFSIIATLIFLIFNFVNNILLKKNIYFFQLLLLIIILFFLILNFTGKHSCYPIPFIVMLIATALIGKKNELCLFIKLTILLNIVFMFYEFLHFRYIVTINNYPYEFGRMQGIFSYSKLTSYFLFSSFLFLRFNSFKYYYYIFFLSSAYLCGSRTSLIFIFIILCFDILINYKFKLNHIFIISFFILITLITSSYLIQHYYDNIVMLNRILNSFNLDSSSHQERIYYWLQYVDYIKNYSFFEIFFGAGIKIRTLMENGAENTYLMILSEFGLLGLSTYLIPLIILLIIKTKQLFLLLSIFCILAFLFVGRLNVGWADGIIFFIFLFQFIFGKRINYLTKIRCYR